MKIAWIYLDKRAATIEALKDYGAMVFIIENHPDDAEEARQRLSALPASCPTGMPRALNPHAGESRLAATLDEIDVLKERYRRALEYMEWFRPAWDALTEDERHILRVFYLEDDPAGRNPVYGLCEHYSIEKTSAYNKKNRALARLTLLLYGK